jgi:hypothetical protein
MKTAVLSFSDTLRKDKQTLDNINAKQTSGADRLKKETAVIDSCDLPLLLQDNLPSAFLIWVICIHANVYDSCFSSRFIINTINRYT